MKGSSYILMTVALIALAGSLHRGEAYVANIPDIMADVGTQIENCQAQKLTVTQRIACVRNVSFADIRKMDLRADNRARSRGGAKTLVARH